MIRIDSHQHFWKYRPEDYDWITPSMAAIRRDFLPPDLQMELQGAGLDGSVSVQARQTLDETHWLLGLAKDFPHVIRGVVGWVPLSSPDVDRHLSELASHPALKGVRHVVQDEPDDQFILRKDFNEGVSRLLEHKLVFDILIFERHLSYASIFVDRHPNQIFVLDHIAKPKIAKHEIQPWAIHLQELAKRPNVFCKLSGMVTEADHKRWQKSDLAPYFDVVLQAFGANRLMFGSDWPVCLLATTYENWANLVKEEVGSLSQSEQDAIFGATAQRAYRL